MDVTVVVATFGARQWLDLAVERATRSAEAQGVPVIYVHGLTLRGARNAGLAQVETDHVVFLDADDELSPGYLEALSAGTADIRVPSVVYVRDGHREPPVMPRVVGHHHACTADCLPEGNWIVIGAMARTELLRGIGGFEDFSWCEDWACWARCSTAGATFEAIPAAQYIAHVRDDSRNRAATGQAKAAAYQQIHRAVWPELYEAEAA